MSDKSASMDAIQQILSKIRQAKGDSLKNRRGAKPVAMEVSITKAEPADGDDDKDEGKSATPLADLVSKLHDDATDDSDDSDDSKDDDEPAKLMTGSKPRGFSLASFRSNVEPDDKDDGDDSKVSLAGLLKNSRPRKR